MSEPSRAFLSGAVHGTNRTPSKRTRPASVPIHKYPSAVCVIAFGAPAKSPSCIRQAVWVYWETCLVGSSATRGLTAKRIQTIPRRIDRGTCIFKLKFQQTAPQGDDDGMGSVVCTELVDQILDVKIDRRFRDRKFE